MQEAEKVAYMFTGQGSQREGMWDELKDFPRTMEIFQLTREITGYDLFADLLTDTSLAQPAILAYSLAALKAAGETYPEMSKEPPAFYLGHSLGEYSALVASGAISFEDAIKLVWQRGVLMKEAGRVNPGKMVALMSSDPQSLLDHVYDICKRSKAEIANFNCPGQIVISGSVQNTEDAVGLAKEKKIKAVELGVSVAAHSSLMEPAKKKFAEVLELVNFKMPEIPVISNVTARPYESVDRIQELLAKQLTSSVYWERSVRFALQRGVTTFIEFGPQPILTGLLKRINCEVRGFCVSNLASLQNLHNPY